MFRHSGTDQLTVSGIRRGSRAHDSHDAPQPCRDCHSMIYRLCLKTGHFQITSTRWAIVSIILCADNIGLYKSLFTEKNGSNTSINTNKMKAAKIIQ